MIYPQLWAQSQVFKAVPILFKDEWVMHIEVNDQSREQHMIDLGLHLTKRNPESFSVGYRGLLSKEQWRAIDDSCDFVEFDESKVFYADQKDYRLTPDYATLLSFVSSVALNDQPLCDQLCLGVPFDEIWDSLSEQDIHVENAAVWKRFVSAYCDAQNASEESIDLIQGIWKRICSVLGDDIAVEIPTLLSNLDIATPGILPDDDVFIALAGTDIFYTVDGTERSGRLARSLLHSAKTAFVVNPDAHWVEGVPITYHIEVNVNQISLSPILVQLGTEFFAHPLTLEHSFEELSADHWSCDNPRQLMSLGLDRMLENAEFNKDAHTLRCINDYAQEQLTKTLGQGSFAMVLRERGWGVGHYDQDAKEVFYFQHDIELTPNYNEAISAFSDLCLDLAKRNKIELQRYERYGLDASHLLYGSEFDIERQTISALGMKLALRMEDLGERNQREFLVSRTRFGMQTSFVGQVPLERPHPSTLEIHKTNSGRFIGCEIQGEQGSMYQSVLNHNVHIGGSAAEVVDEYMSVQEKNPLSAPECAQVLHMAEVVDAMNAVSMKEPRADDFSTVVAQYINTKSFSFKPFVNAHEEWLANVNKRLSELLRATGVVGIVVVANARRFQHKSLTISVLWEKFEGNRERAYQYLSAQMKSIKGLRSSQILILDRMEAVEPKLSQAIDTKILAHETQVKNVSGHPSTTVATSGAREDIGFVKGIAKKDLYLLSKDELHASIRDSDPNGWFDLVKKSGVWPKHSLAALKKVSGSPEAAYVSFILRNALPTQFSKLAENSASVADYITKTREARNSVHLQHSLIKALEKANEYLDSVGARDELGVWPSTGSRPLQSLRARWTKAPNHNLQVLRSFFAERIVQGAFDRQDTPWDFAMPARQLLANKRTQRSLSNLPELAHVERIGSTWRRDGNVSEKDLIMTFGFSGVEYGNWTNQKERAAYMNHTYDSFCDLSELTGLPKTALSFGGQLGLTYGSRGRGGRQAAMAHFEPSHMAIALTKRKGAGSLGHEYFHALSNHFFRKFSVGVQAGDLAEVVANLLEKGEFDQEFIIANAGGMNPQTLTHFAKLFWVMTHQPPRGDWSQFKDNTDDLRQSLPEVAQWTLDSGKQDDEDGRKEAYWSAPCELFARAMEAWVVSVLSNKGQKNDYLVRDGRVYLDAEMPLQVYPSGQHIHYLEQAANRFFGHLKWEEQVIQHPIGVEMVLPVLYSRWGSCCRVPPQILAEQALVEVNMMLGDRVNITFDEVLLDQRGNAVSGQWVPALKMIHISNELGTLGTVRHESFHAARNLLMSDDEINILDVAYGPDGDAMSELCAALRRQGKNDLIQIVRNSPEEAQAYAFQLYCQNDLLMSCDADEKSIFQRIIEFLKEVFNLALGYGVETPTKVFKSLQDGGLLRRERNWKLENDNNDDCDVRLY